MANTRRALLTPSNSMAEYGNPILIRSSEFGLRETSNFSCGCCYKTCIGLQRDCVHEVSLTMIIAASIPGVRNGCASDHKLLLRQGGLVAFSE
jgi:hypothetical protein